MKWDGTFTMTKSPDGSSGFESVPADDILYFRVVENIIQAHTYSHEYYLGNISLDRLSKALIASDPRFYRTDRMYIVNLSKVKHMDKEWSLAYFEEKPSPKSKYCCIVRLKFSDISKRIKTLQ